jgi:hypothetical protein
MSRSFSLRCWEALRSTSKAVSALQCWAPMMMPSAWSMADRELSAVCKCSDSSVFSAILAATASAPAACAARSAARSRSVSVDVSGVGE